MPAETLFPTMLSFPDMLRSLLPIPTVIPTADRSILAFLSLFPLQLVRYVFYPFSRCIGSLGLVNRIYHAPSLLHHIDDNGATARKASHP